MNNSGLATEKIFSEDIRLISTTDLQGRITYVNDNFIDVSGYSSEELIGQAHSIVRHPDMPSAAFKDLWHHLKDDKPWLGAVKNRCKEGEYYWVQAYVTPQYNQSGSKIGYQSVRTSLPKSAKLDAEKLYERLNKPGGRIGLKRMSLCNKLLACIAFCVMLMGFLTLLPITIVEKISLIALAGVAFLFIINWLISPIRQMLNESISIYDNSISQKALTNRMDELGAFQLANNMSSARLRALTGRVEDAIEVLDGVMKVTQNSLEQTTKGIEQQNTESDSLAIASTEMASSSHVVADNTAQTSDVTHSTAEDAKNGRVVINGMIESIEELVADVHEASHLSAALHEQTEEIGNITTLIDQIASQTNLLALNAAIEAARAGDNGRGFAVVADEVRMLALRTQESTEKIKQTVETIKQHVGDTTEVMELSSVKAKDSITRARDAGQAFDDVSISMDAISDRSQQIALSTEKQSLIAESLSQNIESIRSISDSNLDKVSKTNLATAELEKLVIDLSQIVRTASKL